jgi:prepilin-type N-terminal cleavage/methylation domain-containing protein
MTAPRSRQAFTLIELLLVVAIIGVVTAITLPAFVASTRGNRLRAAARTVVQMGRYARSMAVLRQGDMVVTFDLDRHTVSARPGAGAATNALSGDGDTGAGDAAESAPPVGDQAAESDRPAGAGHATGAETLTRKLEPVTIDFVDPGGDTAPVRQGVFTAVFSGNGRCTPYTVQIRDPFDTAVRIEVDALAVTATETIPNAPAEGAR